MIQIARDGQVIDQVTRGEAAVRLRAGTLLATDHYWEPGMPAWRPLGELVAEKLALPFPRPVPAAPSLLDRLLRRRSESDCLAAYWDLLALAPDHGSVPAADLDALDVACGCAVRRRCQTTLRGWYASYVARVLADGSVVDAERALLTRVASAFGIPADRAAEELKGAVLRHYGEQMPLILRTDQPSDDVVASIRRLETSLGVPAAELAEARAKHLSDYFGFLLGEKGASVAPLVARGIRAQAKALDFDLARDAIEERLRQGELRWEAEHGELPVVDVGLILTRGEVCHWTSSAEFLQMKRVTVGISYGGPVASIRLMRGLSWRMASYRGTRETSDEVVKIDEGDVFITNKRIIFNGPLKNLVIRLDRVIDLNCYKNAFQVEQPTGASPYFVIPGDPLVPYRMLTRLCREAQA
ncbi:MAG: hypothetical protein ACO23N_02715 [Opitutales bacterium]